MTNRANQLAEQIEALSREVCDEVNRMRGMLPCKWDWKRGDVCFVRGMDMIYQDEIESIDEEGMGEAKLKGRIVDTHTISTNFLFETREQAEAQTFWDCLDKRIAGITPRRRYTDDGRFL
jgi:hypothetical protein